MSNVNAPKPISFKAMTSEQEDREAFLLGIFKDLLAGKPHIDTFTLGELAREALKPQGDPDKAKIRVEASFLITEASLNTYSAGWYQPPKTKVYVSGLIEGIKAFVDKSQRYGGDSK